VLARPPQGSVQLWELSYWGGPGVHPVHVHLVDFQIVSRTGGSRGVLPYESAGLKDIVLLESGETARVLAYFGAWNGVYMFHCHNLVHEDHMVCAVPIILRLDFVCANIAQMMAAYNVTALEGIGYDTVEDLADPLDSRFIAQPWSQNAYSDSSIQGTLSYLGGLGAYNQRDQISEAIDAYYSKDPSAAIETGTPASVSAPAYNHAMPTGAPNVVAHGAPVQAGQSGQSGQSGHGAAPTQSQNWQDWSGKLTSWRAKHASGRHWWRT